METKENNTYYYYKMENNGMNANAKKIAEDPLDPMTSSLTESSFLNTSMITEHKNSHQVSIQRKTLKQNKLEIRMHVFP